MDAGGWAHQPDATGVAHLPWTLPGVDLGPRGFPADVAVAPGTASAPYARANLST
ncbi:MAG: hypothetical protein HXX12_09935 [Geothrix sp.]|uniref:hypothetical protein n=1 Tax=Geothrix sp. TaxID=1962974 RepID=UPI0017D9A4EB|nr:hypothetical protein [Geothrix sp.]NWJ41278.1 hypothetical protein [Geothrix sp.]WIL20732.1 MAG: hypothetical protein QOZ81_003317 [Geothrix sp.]